MPKLSDSELSAALKDLPNWQRQGAAIQRIYQFPDFKAAMKFVNTVADAAESANHHPDITINYNKVTLQLISHDTGGVTGRDIKMAARIDQLG